jgi:acyl-CoA synthetase (AMP-forming)/AMP-acid ligase II
MVPTNIRWSLAEHIYSIKNSGARFLIVDDAFAETGAEIAKECASVEHVIFAGDGPCPSGMLPFEDLIADAVRAEDAFRNGEDLAGIFYTGGTTGFPKGVMLPHRALWASSFCFAAGPT